MVIDLEQKIMGRMTFLTRKKVEEWINGVWKYTYTNWRPKENSFISGVSGNYIYHIFLEGTPRVVNFEDVPEGYRSCVKSHKIIYETRAILVAITKRDLKMKKYKIRCSNCGTNNYVKDKDGDDFKCTGCGRNDWTVNGAFQSFPLGVKNE